MRVAVLKKKLQELVHDLNAGPGGGRIVFNQQAKVEDNMSLSGANGRMWIQPTGEGYDVSLSGTSLERELSPSMKEIFRKAPDGFKQANSNTGNYRQPYWRTGDFALVKKAAKAYSKTKK